MPRKLSKNLIVSAAGKQSEGQKRLETEFAGASLQYAGAAAARCWGERQTGSYDGVQAVQAEVGEG